MRKYLTTTAVCILLGASAFAPAAAGQFNRHHGDREQFTQNYCGRHSDSDCRDWGQNRSGWDDARYGISGIVATAISAPTMQQR